MRGAHATAPKFRILAPPRLREDRVVQRRARIVEHMSGLQADEAAVGTGERERFGAPVDGVASDRMFKQASEGDAQGERPGMMDMKGRAKFDAWAGLQGMGAEEAMQAYVDLVESLK